MLPFQKIFSQPNANYYRQLSFSVLFFLLVKQNSTLQIHVNLYLTTFKNQNSNLKVTCAAPTWWMVIFLKEKTLSEKKGTNQHPFNAAALCLFGSNYWSQSPIQSNYIVCFSSESDVVCWETSTLKYISILNCRNFYEHDETHFYSRWFSASSIIGFVQVNWLNEMTNTFSWAVTRLLRLIVGTINLD